MTTKRIDPLAVMDTTAETLVRMKGADANRELVHMQRTALIKARAAVAELVEAADEYAERAVYTDLEEPDYERETSEAAIARNDDQRKWWRVRAALAAFGRQG